MTKPSEMTNAELADHIEENFDCGIIHIDEAIKRLRAVPEPPKPETAIQYGEWTIFNGGPCPLKEGERAQVQLASGTRNDALGDIPSLGRDIMWGCVIAFRRVIEPKPYREKMTFDRDTGEISLFAHHLCADPRGFQITITGDTIEAEWVE